MANGRIKTEMGKRNGKGRWMLRSEAKRTANKARRSIGKDYMQEINKLPEHIRYSYIAGSWDNE
jgi:hypothetical protein